MRIMAFSDLHMSRSQAQLLVKASAKADLVVAAGDFCNARSGLDLAMVMLSAIRCPVIAVPGNAESQQELEAVALPNMHVLHGSEITQKGAQFFGLGYAVPPPPFGEWSMNLSELEAKLMLSPCQRADVLISHSPPKGFGDVTSQGDSVGSQSVLQAIEEVKPKLALFGHVHDSWGYRGKIGHTVAANLGPVPSFFDLD
ncbi:Ser/Thr protein phosphatase family protein [Roseobacter sp. SK209-2-6]|uniref:metallophosphoesterase family protein n=1 Tax=Roseobacter sp. SK209-2-6 TaxID=388739 RepID=UPI0000F3D37D|nr:metallophosphoesterase family protein [Roseobacter sp. SK209-2-6]EBA15096.1 Ser/Thr protein phosphatase family protein [Roseobacter sp. SK209-2-6]